ncbi:DGQHR domain-containing protein [Micromonospora sp. NPDC048843]|uniref:DGQHR domain-containing protein n=1 Tax=Micromonospora sp. NPDC048843 TaxID=3155389 RepID=UPI0033CA4E4D
MRTEKPHDVAFRDRVWAAFAQLDFPTINRGVDFDLLSGSDRETPEISVLAADDEVVLVVACHSSDSFRSTQFKREVQALLDIREDMIRVLRRHLPNRKPKFILATNNLAVTQSSRELMSRSGIAHLDEEAIEYYLLLAEHLGKAARFQLLGNLFAGQRIPALDPKVHAIRGRMGGLLYYSFAIEPERLLKLAYVLHRNKANSDLMPTYQRLIKKARLQAVSRFVDEGGFFPNSIILNLETGSRPPQFDAVSKAGDGPVLGTLHLPRHYRAAYVIDGQHRLYGYANSDRATSELVPVVAFVNLPPSDQVRLFMQINENQQPVPKNLRNTLNADLLWDSADLRERVRALKLRIAQYLGESKTSPLHGRIILGENTRSPIRCLTIDAINNGLSRGNFLGSFYKTRIKDAGSFYLGTNQATFEALVPFLEQCFKHVIDGLSTQWQLGAGDGGFVFINTGVESLLRVFSDVTDHVISTEGVKIGVISTEELFAKCVVYLDCVVTHLQSVSPERSAEYRRMYGSGGGTRYWRQLQLAVHESCPDFSPPGLTTFVQEEAKAFNTESFEMIRELEKFLNQDVRRRLEDKFGSARWFQDGVPRKIRGDAARLAVEKNLDLDPDQKVEAWDCLHLINYHEIMTQSQEIWKDVFAQRYTRPSERSKPGAWKSRASWLTELNRIRNENFHTYAVTPSEYSFLSELTAWLIKDQV